MRRGVLLMIALMALTWMSGAAKAEKQAGLKAGAASVKITPSLDRPVWIAGYENNRPAQSVQDDLWARAMVLDDGKTRFAVVACDLIGLSNFRIRRIREQIKSVPSENVLICCTHVHSGPDTLGLWGPTFAKSGVDPEYMTVLEERIVGAVDSAAAALKPVRLRAAKTTVPDGLMHNSREPLQDKELTTLRFVDDKDKTIGTLVHYGGHPEVNKSKALTSDYVHYVREEVEKKTGGVALFLNGALGGMVTPKISGHTLAEMERVGVGIGHSAVAAIEGDHAEKVDQIRLGRKQVDLPLANLNFKAFSKARILDTDPKSEDTFQSEVWRVDLGPVTWITIPGEILPKPALAIKARIPGKFPMVVAMANDELGYILDPDDFEKDLYRYEKSMSVGKETWPKLLEAARELLGSDAR